MKKNKNKNICSSLTSSSSTLTLSSFINDSKFMTTATCITRNMTTTSLTDVSSLTNGHLKTTSLLNENHVNKINESINYNNSKKLSYDTLFTDEENNESTLRTENQYEQSQTCSCQSTKTCSCFKETKPKQQKFNVKRPINSFDLSNNHRGGVSKHSSNTDLDRVESLSNVFPHNVNPKGKYQPSKIKEFDFENDSDCLATAFASIYQGTCYSLKFMYELIFKSIWQALLFKNEINLNKKQPQHLNNPTANRAEQKNRNYQNLPRRLSLIDNDDYRLKKKFEVDSYSTSITSIDDYRAQDGDRIFDKLKNSKERRRNRSIRMPLSNSNYKNDG